MSKLKEVTDKSPGKQKSQNITWDCVDGVGLTYITIFSKKSFNKSNFMLFSTEMNIKHNCKLFNLWFL